MLSRSRLAIAQKLALRSGLGVAPHPGPNFRCAQQISIQPTTPIRANIPATSVPIPSSDVPSLV